MSNRLRNCPSHETHTGGACTNGKKPLRPSEASPHALCGHLGCHAAIRWLWAKRIRRTKRVRARVLRLPSDRVVKPLHRMREQQDHHDSIELPRTQTTKCTAVTPAYHRNRRSPIDVHNESGKGDSSRETPENELYLANSARDDRSIHMEKPI